MSEEFSSALTARAVTGHALACLYAADRYHHVEHEIRPQLKAGKTVVSDRYIPSGLVMQRFDGVGFQVHLGAVAHRALGHGVDLRRRAGQVTHAL